MSIESLQTAIDKLAADGLEHARGLVDTRADEVLESARERCPVDTGALKETIRKRKSGGRTATVSIRAGGKRAPYAGIVEARTKFLETAAAGATSGTPTIDP